MPQDDAEVKKDQKGRLIDPNRTNMFNTDTTQYYFSLHKSRNPPSDSTETKQKQQHPMFEMSKSMLRRL